MFPNTIFHPLGALDDKLLEICIKNQTKTQNYRALDDLVDKLYDNECYNTVAKIKICKVLFMLYVLRSKLIPMPCFYRNII